MQYQYYKHFHMSITSHSEYITEYHHILQCSSIGLSIQSKCTLTNDTEANRFLLIDKMLQQLTC